MPCKSTRILFHHFTSSPPRSRGENPKAMADKGKQPIKEDITPSKKHTVLE
jgi:hypothetical protein